MNGEFLIQSHSELGIDVTGGKTDDIRTGGIKLTEARQAGSQK